MDGSKTSFRREVDDRRPVSEEDRVFDYVERFGLGSSHLGESTWSAARWRYETAVYIRGTPPEMVALGTARRQFGPNRCHGVSSCGECAPTLEGLLRLCQAFRVCLSPHLAILAERFRVLGHDVSRVAGARCHAPGLLFWPIRLIFSRPRPQRPYCPRAPRCLFEPCTSTQTKRI
jgi:hypothetical protein